MVYHSGLSIAIDSGSRVGTLCTRGAVGGNIIETCGGIRRELLSLGRGLELGGLESVLERAGLLKTVLNGIRTGIRTVQRLSGLSGGVPVGSFSHAGVCFGIWLGHGLVEGEV